MLVVHDLAKQCRVSVGADCIAQDGSGGIAEVMPGAQSAPQFGPLIQAVDIMGEAYYGSFSLRPKWDSPRRAASAETP